jgi:endonuclease YncB( thermonuclease family)
VSVRFPIGLVLIISLCVPAPVPGKPPVPKPSAPPRPSTPASRGPSPNPHPGPHPSSNSGPRSVTPTPQTTKLPRSGLVHVLPRNRALMAQSTLHPKLAQQLAARRHHGHWRPWVWGMLPFDTYGLAGRVVGVPSGDRLTVLNASGTPQQVRLFGVAAPVNGPFASASQPQLASQVLGKFVHVHSMGADLDGSLIAKVFLGDAYVNRDQIAAGMAWYFIDHGFDMALAQAEEQAQETGAGLWHDPDPHAPWLASANSQRGVGIMQVRRSIDAEWPGAIAASPPEVLMTSFGWRQCQGTRLSAGGSVPQRVRRFATIHLAESRSL